MADDEIPPERTFPAINVEVAQRKAVERRRQFLIDSVWNDTMLPSEAEELAAGTGLLFDGSDGPVTLASLKWSLAQAVVWIAWRDPSLIQQQWWRLHAWSGSLWRDPPGEHQVVTFERAEAELWAALEAGRVHAVGSPGSESRPAKIEPLDWSNLVWMPEKERLSVRWFGQPGPAYRVVKVRGADMLAVWPAPGMQAPEAVDEVVRQLAPQTSPPTRRGGGAPQQYDWDAMWIEVVRLATEDKITDRPSLSRHLRQWFLDTTGDEPGDTIFKAKMAKLFTTLKW